MLAVGCAVVVAVAAVGRGVLDGVGHAVGVGFDVGTEKADEDVGLPIGVARHQVGGLRFERERAAVAADRGVEAGGVGLASVSRDAHPAGDSGLTVVNEDVGVAVGVAVHQVGGERGERDEASVGVDHGRDARFIALAPGRVEAGPLGHSGLPIVDEDVGAQVGVARHQVP